MQRRRQVRPKKKPPVAKPETTKPGKPARPTVTEGSTDRARREGVAILDADRASSEASSALGALIAGKKKPKPAPPAKPKTSAKVAEQVLTHLKKKYGAAKPKKMAKRAYRWKQQQADLDKRKKR